jgi:hypothetical protein
MSDVTASAIAGIFIIWGLVWLYFGYRLGQVAKVQPIIEGIVARVRGKNGIGDSPSRCAQAPDEKH